MRARTFIVLLALPLAACAGVARSMPGVTEGPPAAAVVEQINAVRALHGLPPLSPAPRLAAAARAHAWEQAALGRISHYGEDGSTLEERVARAGYAMRAGGENVAAGWEDAATVAAGWWDSPPHRENLLRAQTSEIGVGTARGPRGRAYWTLIVAAPAER